MSFPRLLVVSSLLLAPMLGAQPPTYHWSPTGANKFTGGTNNTIPFWGLSARYQQIHDAVDFGPTTTMKGLAMRPLGNRTLTGRTWEMLITMTHTKVAANAMSTTFATNLAGINTKEVFGTSKAYKKFSWKNFTSSGSTNPKPPAFTIPFDNTYLYLRALGNLCWDWRHKNATATAFMVMDATSGTSQRGAVLPSVGKGCFVGKSLVPATARITNTGIGAAGNIFQATLSNATASQAAILALGITQQNIKLGWCTDVELVPVVLAFGKTNASGSWTFQGPIASTAGASAVSVYMQYAYNDAGQGAGLGLSNMVGYRTPNIPGGSGVSRLWKAASNGRTSGDELATTGSRGYRFGLVVGWLQ